MKFIEFFGIIFPLLSVILGAFGAHLLKKSLSESALQSFEVGVRYMMYHGLALLILTLMSFEEKKLRLKISDNRQYSTLKYLFLYLSNT